MSASFPSTLEPGYTIIFWAVMLGGLENPLIPLSTGIFLTLADFLFFLPKAAHESVNRGMLGTFWSTPVHTSDVVKGMARWVLEENIRHAFPAVLICLVYAYTWPTGHMHPWLFWFVMSCWVVLLMSGLISASLPRQFTSNLIPLSFGLVYVMALKLWWFLWVSDAVDEKLPAGDGSTSIFYMIIIAINLLAAGLILLQIPRLIELRRRGAWD